MSASSNKFLAFCAVCGRRFGWFYAAGLVLMTLVFVPKTAVLNRVNVLRSYEQVLEDFESGQGSLSSDDLQGGLRYYRRLAALLPQSALADANQGFCQYYRKDYRRAWAAYHRALAREPEFAPLYWDLGAMSAAQGRDSEATKYFERYLELAPAFQRYYNQLGQHYQRSGLAQGLILVSRIYQRDQIDGESAYVQLVALARRQGDLAAAQSYFFAGIRRYPASADLKRAMEAGVKEEVPVLPRLHLYSELLIARYQLP